MTNNFVLTNSFSSITNGLDSFGYTFVPMNLAKYSACPLVFYSRDEMKQGGMAMQFSDDNHVQGLSSKVIHAPEQS
jgi:hypothetical protein